MRKEFEMTDEQLNKILDACKPVPYMVFGGMEPPSPRENANSAWQHLAGELGFVWDTAEPINGKGRKFFTAIPK
jgi:hypothetical protein